MPEQTEPTEPTEQAPSPDPAGRPTPAERPTPGERPTPAASEEAGDAVVLVEGVARVRRAPRYRAFALAGALGAVVLGVLVTLVVALATGRDADLGWALLAVVIGLGLAGALVGAVAAVLLDRRT